jgi:steroid delta-isomerase-like uncharacterized protein
MRPAPAASNLSFTSDNIDLHNEKQTMTTEQIKTLIRRWVEEGWNKGNRAVMDEVYLPNVVQHDANSSLPVNSSEALKMYVNGYRAAFPDLTFTIDDLIGEGDKVQWRFTSQGTHTGALGPLPATGKHGTVTGMVLFRFAGGQVAEVWVNLDLLGLLQQLGAIPAMAAH